MNRVVISIGIVILVGLIMFGVLAYLNRSPAQTPSPPTTNGFQTFDRGGVSSSAAQNTENAAPIPYAVTPTSTPVQPPAPVYQVPIVTTQPATFSAPFIQYVQPSPVISQPVIVEQTQPEVSPPPVPEPQPIQAPVAASTSPLPNLAAYIPYNGPASPPPKTVSSGGGGGGGSDITSILIDLGIGVLAYLVAGPIGAILVGSLAGGITSLFGGGGGGGGGGGLGALFGGSGSGATGNFGGKITNVTYCTCSVSLMLDIDDVRGQSISLIFSPGSSDLYADYNVFESGPEVLGTYSQGGGQCQVYSGESCNSQGSPQGTIKMIGTSEY